MLLVSKHFHQYQAQFHGHKGYIRARNGRLESGGQQDDIGRCRQEEEQNALDEGDKCGIEDVEEGGVDSLTNNFPTQKVSPELLCASFGLSPPSIVLRPDVVSSSPPVVERQPNLRASNTSEGPHLSGHFTVHLRSTMC